MRRDDEEPSPWSEEGSELAQKLMEEGIKNMPPEEPKKSKKKGNFMVTLL